jgi:hypothetical protein
VARRPTRLRYLGPSPKPPRKPTCGPTLPHRHTLHSVVAKRLYEEVPGTPAQLDPVAAALWDAGPRHLGLPLVVRGLAACRRLQDPSGLPHPPACSR